MSKQIVWEGLFLRATSNLNCLGLKFSDVYFGLSLNWFPSVADEWDTSHGTRVWSPRLPEKAQGSRGGLDGVLELEI